MQAAIFQLDSALQLAGIFFLVVAGGVLIAALRFGYAAIKQIAKFIEDSK